MALDRNQKLHIQRQLEGWEDDFEVPDNVVEVIERMSARSYLDNNTHFGGSENMAIALEIGELLEEVKELRREINELRNVEEVQFNWDDVERGTDVMYTLTGSDEVFTGKFNGYPKQRWRGRRVFINPDEDPAKQLTARIEDVHVCDAAGVA